MASQVPCTQGSLEVKVYFFESATQRRLRMKQAVREGLFSRGIASILSNIKKKRKK